MSGLWERPVTANLLTGFLGSGKTTLLKRLLRQPDLRDTAVLINEFGEVGLDHLLVEEVDEDVVLLQSGCVCCTIRGDLKDALLRLHGRRQRGEVPAFDRVVIETTGLADPAPILATLASDAMLRHHFRTGATVTVVDAVTGLRTLESHPESVRQAAAADRLIVSKTDLAEAVDVVRLRARLAALNPAATIVESGEDSDAAATLLTGDMHGGIPRVPLPEEIGHAHSHEHDADEASRHGGIRATLLTAEEPLDWTSFALWLSMLLNRHGANVLRIKGLAAIAGSDTPVVVQGVQHLIHKPAHLERWPDGDRRTRLVVIANGIDPELLRRSFAAYMRLDPGARAGRAA